KEWFRHGRGPVKDAGEELAHALPPPRTLAGALAELLQRPRLAGARAFVAQLVSALTLPPRRLQHEELPMGGYADVTTHGHVDQLLPSQFALDEWDFFRRFAENELLYFRREEPHAQTRRELVVLLDQGVRTWGDVRLVLSAAVLALGKQAARSSLPFSLATTGAGGEPVDPLELAADELGELVEASDLTPNPGRALERVLEQPAPGVRDVVLLTHPRNLAEADVAAAARGVTGGARLFAVVMDAAGNVDLAELKRGVPVGIRQFRIDFTQSVELPVHAEADGVLDGPRPWPAHREPRRFPLRLRLGRPVEGHPLARGPP